jgi:hypothetical protein
VLRDSPQPHITDDVAVNQSRIIDLCDVLHTMCHPSFILFPQQRASDLKNKLVTSFFTRKQMRVEGAQIQLQKK